jgi:lysine decarboxylase
VARTRRSGGLLDPDRLDRAFDATLTTSPSGAILASIDACRALLAQHGPRLSKQLLEVVAGARRRLRDGGITVLDGPTSRPGFDPSKLVVDLSGTGVHGHDVEADLQRHGCPAEMADRDLLVAIVTYADGPDDVDHFVDVVLDSVRRHQGGGTRGGSRAASTVGGERSQDWSAVWSLRPMVALPPREAFFARHEVVTAERAVGRVCAELIAPYPPGIPVLAPGEVVTAEVLAALRGVHADGGRIAYAADPDLTTIHVVA